MNGSGCVRFSPNGQYVSASTLDDQILIWDFASGTLVRALTGHKNTLYCLSTEFWAACGGQWVVSGSEDCNVYVWNIQNSAMALALNHSPSKFFSASPL